MPHARRRLAFALLVAFGATSCAFALAATDDAAAGAATPPGSPQQQEDPETAQALADKYAPIVYLRNQEEPCDPKGEPYRPSPVEIVLGNPEVELKEDTAGEPTLMNGPTAAHLFNKGEGYFLDFPGNPKKPGCTYDDAFQAVRQEYPDAVAYAHLAAEPGFSGLALQYWFYFYFNDWNNNHESDWEMIQLVFDAGSAAEALEQAPVRVAYAQHGGGETASWNDAKVKKDNGKPIVHTARGGHGSYYSSDVFFGKGEQGTGFGCDNASDPSSRNATEARLIPDSVTDAASPYAWITYEGRWGEKQHGEFNGPTGPNMKTQWTKPLSWEEDLRDSSVEVPSETIGPNAVKWFCGAVAIGSALLFGLGPAVMAALALAVLAGATITLRRTRFNPATPAPLRQRRQFGQILRGASLLYRQRFGLFLTIGAVFIPLGAITAALQEVVFSFTPTGSLVNVLDNGVLSSIIALGIGALQLGTAYWIVSVAVIAALGALDTGQPVTLRESYRTVLRNAGPLIRARLRTLVIIFLLSATVIGIPLAIYRGVRWTFLEHARLLDGVKRQDAAAASEAVVSGAWWRTCGTAYLLVLLGVATGPVVGMALVLLTSTALIAVNVISSVIYLVLIPYVAIALTLLYFDLQAHSVEEAGRGN